MITPHQLRRQFIDFFVKKHGHKEIPSASVVPENDPTVLFTTAGMHPLVPFLQGEPHPMGKRLVDAQKCVRTDDIEEVGDETHLTFFEMLGNWSLGDYFKEEAIAMSFELLTTSWNDGGFGFSPADIYVTVFEGDSDCPRDEESIKIWQETFKKVGFDAKVGEKIFMYGKEENWWGPAGQTGPCGPDTEMFLDTGKRHDATYGDHCHPNCECGKYVEVWNDVFMQFNKKADGSYEPLKQKNVDTGLGFERLVMLINDIESPYDTELFTHAKRELEKYADNELLRDPQNQHSMRVVLDHLRAATFMIGDPFGVVPSNTDQGYVLRRLIRRAIRHGKKLGITKPFSADVAKRFIEDYQEAYPELKEFEKRIYDELKREEEQFAKTIDQGEKEFEKIYKKLIEDGGEQLPGDIAFKLYDTYGYPIEMTQEISGERGIGVDMKGYEEHFKKHQELSRAGAEQKFAGGLADHSEATKMHHTATHLVQQALRDVLGNHVYQKGSNVTKERLRFDFSHSDKMTPEQIKQTEDIVNEQIEKDLPVHFELMEVDEAKKTGAIGLFDDKYAQMGNKVKIYFMGDYSKEVCGGPHVEHTGTLKHFKITKEQACSAGVRRIKAVVEGIKDVTQSHLLGNP